MIFKIVFIILLICMGIGFAVETYRISFKKDKIIYRITKIAMLYIPMGAVTSLMLGYFIWIAISII